MKTISASINGKPLIAAEIEVHTEPIDVTTEFEPDPTWSTVDSNGHFHAFTRDNTLPTLLATQIQMPCDGQHLVPMEDEFCEGYIKTEYHCTICDEEIKPAMRHTSGRKYAPGIKSWTINVTGNAADLWQLSGLVSVRVESEGKTYFGIGHFALRTAESSGAATGLITGRGELGTR